MINELRRRVVTDYLDATVRLDLDAMGGFLTDDFVLRMVPSARDHGMPIPLVGREQFIDFVRALQERPGMWAVRSFVAEQFLFDEDSVAVRVRLIGEFASGFPYDNEYVFIYRFAGEKICEMREFTDTAYIASLTSKAKAPAV